MTEPFQLSLNPKGELILRRESQDDIAGVKLRRAFPWSSPTHFISVRSGEGKEILLIDDIAALPAETKQIAEDWLARHSFIPKITRVKQINLDFGYQQWEVETDRGPAEFRVQEREDVRFLHDGRFSIKDADGNIYELPGLDTLDRESRKVVEALL